MAKSITRDDILAIAKKYDGGLDNICLIMNVTEDVLDRLGYKGKNMALEAKDFRRQNLTFKQK